MLKKLLASVLAVATVATCASVASAATTYVTADEEAYAVWQLENPEAAPEAEVDVTVYVAGNVADTSAISYTVKTSKNTVETAKEEVAKKFADEKDVKKYDIVVSATASANVYVAHVTEKLAVKYYPLFKGVGDPVELGYYASPVTSAVLADMYTKVAAPKLAGRVFTNWVLDGTVVYPDYRNVTEEEAQYFYTEVAIAVPGVPTYATWLKTGAYVTEGEAVELGKVVVPNTDKADWATYIKNLITVASVIDGPFTAEALEVTTDNGDAKVVTYEYNTVRAFNTKDGVVYAVLYKAPKAEDAAKTIDYSLEFMLEDGTSVAVFSAAVATEKYTTDAAEVYALITGTKDFGASVELDAKKFDTVEKFLNEYFVEEGVKFAVKSYIVEAVNTLDKYVDVVVVVDPSFKHTVYSFGANDEVVKSEAYLNAEQCKLVSYTNKDTAEKFVPAEVMNVTAADLGVAEKATIDGVPAVFAYAQELNYQYVGDYDFPVVYVTYKMGDATVELADFATTTGKFNAEAYFCREAKAGDEVTLKVSLSAAGEAKKLDVAKIAVEFDVIGATAGETYAFAATELYKAGTAAQITLAEGTNIVTATVYYNGVKVGTFAPFYAAV